MARGEEQRQLIFWQSDLISCKLILAILVLLSNAKMLGGNEDELSMLPEVLMVIPFCKHLPAIMSLHK